MRGFERRLSKLEAGTVGIGLIHTFHVPHGLEDEFTGEAAIDLARAAGAQIGSNDMHVYITRFSLQLDARPKYLGSCPLKR